MVVVALAPRMRRLQRKPSATHTRFLVSAPSHPHDPSGPCQAQTPVAIDEGLPSFNELAHYSDTSPFNEPWVGDVEVPQYSLPGLGRHWRRTSRRLCIPITMRTAQTKADHVQSKLEINIVPSEL